MRYRRLHYRYAMVVRPGGAWPFGELSQGDRLRFLVEPRWRPVSVFSSMGPRLFRSMGPPGSWSLT
jgi:hypothetical protein